MEDDLEEWDVRGSLFDDHTSQSMQANLEYMWKKFGFYFPEADLLADPEGLLKYLVSLHLTKIDSHPNQRASNLTEIWNALTRLANWCCAACGHCMALSVHHMGPCANTGCSKRPIQMGIGLKCACHCLPCISS